MAANLLPMATPKTGVLAGYKPLASTRDPATMTSADLRNIAGPSSGPTSYTPTDDALTSKTLTKLLNQNDPYMQQARTRAAQYASTRGLNNSSIAAGAGESAAIDAAMPIAQADAGAFLQSQRDNANAANEFGMADNQFGRQGALAIAGAGWDRDNLFTNLAFDREQTDADKVFRTGERVAGQEFEAGQGALDRSFRSEEAGRDRTFRTGERVAGQDFAATEAGRDRTFRSDEAATGRQFQTAERLSGQDFTAGRDITLGNQRLTEIKVQTEAALAQYDARDKTSLSADYRQTAQRTYDDYASAVSRLQESDMDPDAKAAQVQGLQRVYEDRQVFVNALFQNAPQWASDWSQVALDWNED